MSRKRDPFELRLYGFAEAARYLDVSVETLWYHRRRGKLITPVAELECGPVWSESQLDEQLWLWRGKLGPERRNQHKEDAPCRHLETRRTNQGTECVACGMFSRSAH